MGLHSRFILLAGLCLLLIQGGHAQAQEVQDTVPAEFRYQLKTGFNWEMKMNHLLSQQFSMIASYRQFSLEVTPYLGWASFVQNQTQDWKLERFADVNGIMVYGYWNWKVPQPKMQHFRFHSGAGMGTHARKYYDPHKEYFHAPEGEMIRTHYQHFTDLRFLQGMSWYLKERWFVRTDLVVGIPASWTAYNFENTWYETARPGSRIQESKSSIYALPAGLFMNFSVGIGFDLRNNGE